MADSTTEFGPMTTGIPLPATARRRSTAKRVPHPRMLRWIVVFGFAGLILALGLAAAVVSGVWIFFWACVAMAGITGTTQYLAEVDIATARRRGRALDREAREAARELLVYKQHFARAHNAILRANPVVADELLADLNVAVLRNRVMDTARARA